ncbi:hypothetical protein SRHO_G00155250 [Serrasalmus rhombeus]
MTEAVDRLRLLQFVLIQALLLTGCSSECDKKEVTPAPPEEVTHVSSMIINSTRPGPDVDKSARNYEVVVIFAALLTILGFIGLAIFCRNHKTTISQRLNFDLCRKQSTSQGMV